MPDKSYSQYGEDILIWDIFKDIHYDTWPKLLDIGAWDPFAKSNSRMLIEKGWRAVLVEPSPGPLRNLIKAYNESGVVQVVGAAVGRERGIVHMEITDDAVSTSDASVANTWREKGGYIGAAFFPVITIKDIFDWFGGPYEFINIDAEGLSVMLLEELLKTEAFPRVICVEHDNRIGEIMAMASPKGYRAKVANAESAGTNLILVRE